MHIGSISKAVLILSAGACFSAGAITRNFPPMFFLEKNSSNDGSMHGDTLMILLSVAVGAIAIVLQLRMPNCITRARVSVQSSECQSSRAVSNGRMPFDQSEPSNVEYAPRSI